jgi:uncharacterized damage-inducible protein DinB
LIPFEAASVERQCPPRSRSYGTVAEGPTPAFVKERWLERSTLEQPMTSGYDRPMPPQTPYTNDLAGREPIAALRETTARISTLARAWSPADFERSYAPGKWSARQILTHLAQTELALGTRARMALATPGYVAQSFDQDQWMTRESRLSGHAAAAAFVAVASMNVELFAALSPADREIPLSHPEYGELTVDWIIHQMAGHQIHHLRQLESIV